LYKIILLGSYRWSSKVCLHICCHL